MGAHGPRGLALAGQRADLWLSDPQRHVNVVAMLAGRVRSAAADAGRPVRIGMFRDGWIGDSRAECEDAGRNAMTGLGFELTDEQESRDFPARSEGACDLAN